MLPFRSYSGFGIFAVTNAVPWYNIGREFISSVLPRFDGDVKELQGYRVSLTTFISTLSQSVEPRWNRLVAEKQAQCSLI